MLNVCNFLYSDKLISNVKNVLVPTIPIFPLFNKIISFIFPIPKLMFCLISNESFVNNHKFPLAKQTINNPIGISIIFVIGLFIV